MRPLKIECADKSPRAILVAMRRYYAAKIARTPEENRRTLEVLRAKMNALQVAISKITKAERTP